MSEESSMPENKLKYGEKVFLFFATVAIIGTCATLLVLCGTN